MDLSPDASAAPRLAPGTVLRGRFAITRFVAVIPAGELYAGTDGTDGKPVQVKLIARELVAQAPVRIRLQQDGAIAAQLDHKNIAAHYGFFIDGDSAFFAGEPIDGPTLREMLEKKQGGGRAFSLKGAFNIATHLCNALELAHAAMPHGLLSLDTVHVNPAGRVKIVDFGLARALGTQEAFRSAIGLGITTMAPEFFSAGEPDRRADIYSVGALLFELLTGRSREHDGEKLSVLLPGIPAALDKVMDRAMAALPEERYRDALELKLAIHDATEEALADKPAPPRSAPPPPPSSSSSSPNLGPPRAATAAPPPPPPFATSAPEAPASAGTPALGTLAGPLLDAMVQRGAGEAGTPRAPAVKPGSAPLPPPPAASPLAGADDQHERWLIQKDRLDLGPFRLSDVKLQIEKGLILGEHTIVDMDTGARVRVRDHALLKDLVVRAEGVLQSMRELEQNQAEQRARRKSTLLVTSIVAGAVLVGGGGIGIYAWRQQQKTETKVVYVDREANDEFKIDNIQMKVDPPAPKKKPGPGAGGKHHPGAGGKAGEFDAVTNLGDATEGGGDETLSQEVVNGVMTRNFGLLKGCLFEEKRRDPSVSSVEFDFVIRGNGQVSAVKANGKTDSPLASCIYGKMQAVPFPKFNGSRTHASFSLALR